MVIENSGRGMKRILFFGVMELIMSMTVLVPVTKAGLISVISGTSAPAATLCSYEMTPFAEDLRQVLQEYSFVASPLGGNITFNMPLEHRSVPEQWLFWSHGYSGDVYWTGENGGVINMTMPSGTVAFYFYAEPRDAGVQTITAVAFDGVSDIEIISQDIDCNKGASYFGFYGTGGSVITDIMVYSEKNDLAIGEFGISMIPVPEALLLSNIGLSLVIELKRYRIL